MADEETPDEETPDEETPDEETPDEETPAEDADTPVEEAPAEEADPEGDPGDTDGEGAAPADDAPGGDIDETTSGNQPPRRTGRAAAVVAGAVVAGAVAAVGAVWAIAAIVDDDDDYDDDYYGVVDYATSFEGDGEWGSEPRAYRDDRHERFEHGRRDWSDRRERAERRQERRDRRDRRDREGRDERKGRGDRDGEKGHEPGESSDPGPDLDAGKCETVLSLGTGDDAVTILVCNAPGAEWPGFEPGGGGDSFEFRKRPRGFWFSPPYGPDGEWPFKDGAPFGDGWSFNDGAPFGFEDFEGSEGLEGLEGLDDLFRDGDRGFRFRGDGSDGSQDSFCFRDGDEEQCFSDLGQLSDEEWEQLERMMELLEGFGIEGFLGGFLDSLDGPESELPESQTDPAGVTGA